MEDAVLISICIPAYKKPSFLKRLLDSIQIQTYRCFEVVLTDDSPDTEVFELCRTHILGETIRYFKNKNPLGTPENWNESLKLAKGEWIKIMHDDDWFAAPEALKTFAETVARNPEGDFFFSAYRNVFLSNNTSKEVHISSKSKEILDKNPKTLLSRNTIGPPSVTFHKKRLSILYDGSLKWLVDVDFYIRFLNKVKPVYIPEVLIQVGVGEAQVTMAVFRNPQVEIPENLYELNKIGVRSLLDITVYDAYWRFIRNLDIRSMIQIRAVGYEKPVPPIIQSMISFQSTIPKTVLNLGVCSKILMSVHFIMEYRKIARG